MNVSPRKPLPPPSGEGRGEVLFGGNCIDPAKSTAERSCSGQNTGSAPTLFLAGPTAVGKSEVALTIAEAVRGEIISVDSMQVYRGLDIGTAKPSAEERTRVRHHLIDVVDLTNSFDAAQFVKLARDSVAEIQSRGRIPVFCGGSGLYFKAFLEGLGESPPSNPSVRAELEAAPLEDLLKELEERDPVIHAQIDPKNPRRVIRALEVIRLTGKTFSSQRSRWSLGQGQETAPPYFFGLRREPGDLQARIDSRVDEMFRRGLVQETKHLLARGLSENRTAMRALGYRQVIEHLRGERSLAEAIEQVKIRTRQFAKRQMTWFRKQTALKWIDVGAGDSGSKIAERILQAFRL